MYFQLGRQKCTSSWEDRSVLPVRTTEVHFQLRRQKCTSSWEDRSALQEGKIRVCIIMQLNTLNHLFKLQKLCALRISNIKFCLLLNVKSIINVFKKMTALPVGKTEVHFQLRRQKCTSSWGVRSELPVRYSTALPVGKTEVHFK